MEKKVQTTIRLPEELRNQIQREADGMGLSFNAYLLIVIDKGIRDQQKVFRSFSRIRQRIP